MGVVKDAVKDIVHGVGHAVTGVVHAVEDVGKDVFHAAKDAVGGVVHGVEDVGKAVGDVVTLHPEKALDHLGDAVGAVVKGDVHAAKDVGHAVVDPVKDIVKNDFTAVKEIGVGTVALGTGGLVLGGTAHALAQGDHATEAAASAPEAAQTVIPGITPPPGYQPSEEDLAQASNLISQGIGHQPYIPSDLSAYGTTNAYSTMAPVAPQYSLQQLNNVPAQVSPLAASPYLSSGGPVFGTSPYSQLPGLSGMNDTSITNVG